MFKLRKFKSSFNVYNGTTKGGHPEQISYGTSSLNGAYRASRTELSMCGTYVDPPVKPRPAGPILPIQPNKAAQSIQTNPKKNVAPQIPQAPSGVPRNPQGAPQVAKNTGPPPNLMNPRPAGPVQPIQSNPAAQPIQPNPNVNQAKIKNVAPQIPQAPSGVSSNPQGAPAVATNSGPPPNLSTNVDPAMRPRPAGPIPPNPNQTGQPIQTNPNVYVAQHIPQAPSGVSRNPQEAPQVAINTGPPPNLSSKQLDAYKRVEKKRLEEQKKLEKKRLEEQKKMEKKHFEEQKKSQKLELKEQAKQEKLRKEREKKEAQRLKKEMKNKKQMPQRPLANPLAQSSQPQTNNPAPQSSNSAPQSSTAPYSTNTLNSSISKSSGPPPYSEVPPPKPTQNETNSNVQFSKPVETDSWDLVSQHRQNVIVNKHASQTQPVKGQTSMDLNFNAGAGRSDA